MAEYNSVSELEADGYVKTPQPFHDGKGLGSVYAKSVPDDEGNGFHYSLFSVDSEGVVAPYSGPAVKAEEKKPADAAQENAE